MRNFKDILNQTPDKVLERIRKERRSLNKEILHRFANKGNIQDPELNVRVSDLLDKAQDYDPEYLKSRRNPYADLRWYLHCWKAPIKKDNYQWNEKALFLLRATAFAEKVAHSHKTWSEDEKEQARQETGNDLTGDEIYGECVRKKLSPFSQCLKNWFQSRFNASQLSKLGFSCENFSLGIVFDKAEQDIYFKKLLNQAIDEILPDEVFYSWKNADGKYSHWKPNPQDWASERKVDKYYQFPEFSFEQIKSQVKQSLRNGWEDFWELIRQYDPHPA